MQNTHAILTRTWPAAFALALCGCGPAAPPTYPVAGTVEVAGGDVGQLAGSHVEAALDADPNVRASGEISPDGRFVLETLHAGAILRGAREGTYQARIIPNDDDGPSRRRANAAVAPRFLRFKTSGLTFKVPPDGAVALKVSKR